MCIKNKLFYAGIVCIMFSCNEKHERLSYRIAFQDKALLALIAKYCQENLENQYGGKGVIIIDMTQWNNGFPVQDTVKMTIYSQIHYIQGGFKPPTCYTMVKNRPVLIYTGVETFVSMEKEYVNEIEHAIFPFLNYYDPNELPLNMPSNYSPATYMVTYIDGELIKLEKNE